MIEFKAEVKLDLKYIREKQNTLVIKLDELNKKIAQHCMEIAILKVKAAIYAGIVGAIAGMGVTIAATILK